MSKSFTILVVLSLATSAMCATRELQSKSLNLQASLSSALQESQEDSLGNGRFVECSLDEFRNWIPGHEKYIFTEKTVTTEDGYMNRLLRVQLKPEFYPHLPKDHRKNPTRPILVNHGLDGDATQFFPLPITEENRSPPLVLLKMGFDVWFGNNRGTKYSQGHINANISDKDYWNFSWEEMGLYDVKANIKGVLEEYEADQQLIYFGGSMGTTQMFIALTDPTTKDYVRSKIKQFVAFSPIAYLSHTTQPGLKLIAELKPIIFEGAELFDLYSILGTGCTKDLSGPAIDPKWTQMKAWACNKYGKLCSDDELDIFGQGSSTDTANPDSSQSAMAAKVLEHYAQLIADFEPHFRKFDYGPFENQRRYKSVFPTEWDLSDYNTLTHFIVGGEDPLASPENTKHLLDHLSHCHQVDEQTDSGECQYTHDVYDTWSHKTAIYPPELADAKRMINNLQKYLGISSWMPDF